MSVGIGLRPAGHGIAWVEANSLLATERGDILLVEAVYERDVRHARLLELSPERGRAKSELREG